MFSTVVCLYNSNCVMRMAKKNKNNELDLDWLHHYVLKFKSSFQLDLLNVNSHR